MTYLEENKIMEAWLDIAQELYQSGAEVSRVENSLEYLAKAQGATNISTFSINSTITMTCTFPDGNIVTQTRRIVGTPSFNFRRFEDVNSISRISCREHSGADEIKKSLAEISTDDLPLKIYAGSFIVAFSFAVFFGGKWYDGILSGLLGLFVCLCSRCFTKYLQNTIFLNFFTALILGVFIGLICKIFPIFNQDKILIGDVMLLIPGLTISGSMRDMLVGDVISGATRFIESLLWAGALAVGLIVAFVITGGIG